MKFIDKIKNIFKKNETVQEETIENPIEDPIKDMFEEEMVYVNMGASVSKKYHSSPNAHNMEGAVAINRKEADAQGFIPCSKCFKK